MSWSSIAPGPDGLELRRQLVLAVETVYAENVQRHVPDELGDNNKTFGTNVSENLKHFVTNAARSSAIASVTRGRSFQLHVLGYAISFYKAPPGATSVASLSFDDSDFKQDLVQHNATIAQRELDFESGDPAGKDPDVPQVIGREHIVIAHFGSAEDGFSHAVVGAPHLTDTGTEWKWQEAFEIAAEEINIPNSPVLSDPAHAGGFGLRLKAVPAVPVERDEE